jgi:hypothetical protein
MAKRNRPKKGTALQSMADQMRADGDLQNQQALVNPQGETKMSTIITELIEPYRHMATNRASYHNLVATACIAWNTANLPEDQWQANISEALDELPNVIEEMRSDVARLILELVKRKVTLFPDNQRMIVNFKITETTNNYHLGIASTRDTQKDENNHGST